MNFSFLPDQNKSVLFNTLVQIMGKGIFGLCGLFLVAYLTRRLGSDGFGGCVTLFAWVSTIVVVADMGLYLTGVRNFSHDCKKSQKTMSNLLSARVMTAFIAVFIACVLILVVPYNAGLKKLILLALPSVLFISFARACKSWFQARLSMHFPVIAEIAGCLTMVVITIAGVQSAESMEESLLFIVWGLNSGTFLYAAIAGSFALGFGYPGFRFQAEEVVRLIREAAPLGLSAILAILYFRFDMLMLSWLKPVSHVGVYGTAYTVVEVSAVLPAIFLGSMIPLFVFSMSRKHGDIKHHFQNAFSALALFAVPMLAGGLVLADPIMGMLRGESAVFDGSTRVFQILLLVSVLMFWGQLNGHILVSGGKQKVILNVYFLLVPLNILLNLLLIPGFSYTGAACATLISEIFAIVLTSKIVHKEYALFPGRELITAIFAGALFMAFFLALIDNFLEMNVLWMIVIGIIFYSLFMLIFFGKKMIILLKTFS